MREQNQKLEVGLNRVQGELVKVGTSYANTRVYEGQLIEQIEGLERGIQ